MGELGMREERKTKAPVPKRGRRFLLPRLAPGYRGSVVEHEYHFNTRAEWTKRALTRGLHRPSESRSVDSRADLVP